MTLDEFKLEINEAIKSFPSCWRYGQSVFNYIDGKYHIARTIQFNHGIDCFYDDSKVDEFINVAYALISE